MDSTVSISKGCFVFKNGFKINKKKKNRQKNHVYLYEQQFVSEDWYRSFKNMWIEIEIKLKELNLCTYEKVLKELVYYVKNCYNNENLLFSKNIVPCATLLTGINQPDHVTQFEALKRQLLNTVTPHVAILYSQDSSTLKHVIENMVFQFVNGSHVHQSYDDDDDDESETNEGKNVRLKKTQGNLSILKCWYEQTRKFTKTDFFSPSKKKKYKELTNQLVVIIPDFENFNVNTLQDLIVILSGYAPELPFVLIFGIATSVSALHKTFPYHVSSKLLIQVFQSHSSTSFLNEILETVFLSEKCPFRLGEKPFKVLIDIFLFYDFSVRGFIQGIKYCMMEHYYNSKIMALCCDRKSISEVISGLRDTDLECIRILPSFKIFLNSKPPAVQTSLTNDNEIFKTELIKELNNFHDYLTKFHLALKILHIFVQKLPQTPLGKQLRELYPFCVSSSVIESPEYKQCIKLLTFQSKEEIVDLINNCLCTLNEIIQKDDTTIILQLNSPKKVKKKMSINFIHIIYENLTCHLSNIKNATLAVNNMFNESEINMDMPMNRKQLKEKFKIMVSSKTLPSDFEIARNKFVDYLTKDVFSLYLKPANSIPFHEIFLFEDMFKVKKNILGTPRAAIHSALTNPALYLQCKCCILPREESILQMMPDICIIYKLHLECGKLINLYDWLQAFLTIVDPLEKNEDDGEDRRDVNPEIQARFTRAVTELQFLGFIKTSQRKTDHVSRLTW